LTEPPRTRAATWEDVLRLCAALNDSGCDYALIGGYALSAHGIGRMSEDIDFLVDPSPRNTPKWVQALSILEDKASLELANEPDVFETMGNYALRINDEITVDVMPAACGHLWSELRNFIVERTVDGTRIRVLSLEGMLLTKEGMRDKDKADARVIRLALAHLASDERP
jgi:hypothetical protein